MKRATRLALVLALSLSLVAGGTGVSVGAGQSGDGQATASKKKKKCAKGKKRAKKGPKKGKCVKKKKKAAETRHCYATFKCGYLRSADGMEAQFRTTSSEILNFPRELVFPIPGCGPEPTDPLGAAVLKNVETTFLRFKVNGTKIGQSPLSIDPNNRGSGGASTSDGRAVGLNYDIQGQWTAVMRMEGSFTFTQTRTENGQVVDQCSRTVPFVFDRT